MRLYTIALTTILTAVCVAAPLRGQAVDELQVGARVRVWHASICCMNPQTGTLLKLSADSLHIQPDSASAPVSIARASVREISRSRWTDRFWAGLGLGAAIGTVGGAIAGYSAGGSDNGDFGDLRAFSAVLCGVMGGMFGAVLGAAVGGAMQREVWDHVSNGGSDDRSNRI